jgi:hypothetical protein
MAISNNARGSQPGVCTSTTRPTAPYEGQMIYETDTDLVLVWSGSAWVEIASSDGSPRGIVAATAGGTSGRGFVARTSGDISLPTSNGDLGNLTITFNAVAGRLYKISFSSYVANTGAGSQTIIIQITTGANTAIQSNLQEVPAAKQAPCTMFVIVSGLTGSNTYKIRGRATTYSGALLAASVGNEGTATFVIEDIGAA